MLTALVEQARAVVENVPSGATAKGNVPLALRWLLVKLRKDTKAREKLLDGVEGVMEHVVENLTRPVRHAPPPPAKKGRGKKGATALIPEPMPAPAAQTFNIQAMTPPELLTLAIADLDHNDHNVVGEALDVLRYEDDFEQWLIAVLNEQIPNANVGPWHCMTDIGGGAMKVRLRVGGEEQDEDTEHPGHTDETRIEQVFKHTLGAVSANFNWSLDRTPSNWGFDSGDKFVLNYDGTADFKYPDGQAAVFATGNKPMLERAAEVLARAKEE